MKNIRPVLIAVLFFAAGCFSGRISQKDQTGTVPQTSVQTTKTDTKKPFIKIDEESYPHFIDKDAKKSLMKALALNGKYLQNSKKETVYDFDGRKVTVKELAATNEAFAKAIEEATDAEEFDRIIRERFDIYQMSGVNGDGVVTFTSYYEPTTEASLEKTAEYKYPMYAKP